MWFKNVFKSPLLLYIVTLGLSGACAYQLSSMLRWADYNANITESLWILINNPNLEPTERIRIKETARISQVYSDKEGNFIVNFVTIVFLPLWFGLSVHHLLLNFKKRTAGPPTEDEADRKRVLAAHIKKFFKSSVLLYTVVIVIFLGWEVGKVVLKDQAVYNVHMTDALWTLVNNPELEPDKKGRTENDASIYQYILKDKGSLSTNIITVFVLSSLLGFGLRSLPLKWTNVDKIKDENKDR